LAGEAGEIGKSLQKPLFVTRRRKWDYDVRLDVIFFEGAALGSRRENGRGADRQISPKMLKKTGVYLKEKSVRHFYAGFWVAGHRLRIRYLFRK
jgi:hypothetical protein